MSASPETPDDAQTQVRAALGEWGTRASQGLVPDFARDLSVVSIKDKTAYAGFLRCVFDVRTAPVDKMLAFRAAAPPQVGNKKDLWSVPSGLSRQFLEQEETVVAAESAEPIACNRCAEEGQTGACEACRGAKTAPCETCSGRGRKSCASCGGKGSICCAQCAGSGKVTLSVAADGMPNEDVCPACTGQKQSPCRDCADAAAPDCAACGNKRVVACARCEGSGSAPCSACGGARRVIRGFSMTIAYKLTYYRSLLRDASVPEATFPEDPSWGKLGDTVYEREAADAAAFAADKPEGRVGEAFAKVLKQLPAAGLGANSKLVLLALTVEKIPIYEATYAFGGKEYHAWTTRFENRVLPLDDPFADLAVSWADEAEAFLDKGDYVRFEERAAQAAKLAPKNKAVAELRGKAGAVQRRAVLSFGAKVCGGLAVAIPAVLALAVRSPNRWLPLAALALGIFGAAFASVFRLGAALASRPLLPPSRRKGLSAAAASGAAVLLAVLFLLVAPVRRIDAREFAGKVAGYRALPFANWGAEDDAGLAAAIKDYGARGVDAADGQTLLDERASFLAAAKAQAILDAQAAQRAADAARRRAEEAKKEAAREKALAAKRAAAAKKAAALKAAKKKKKKK